MDVGKVNILIVDDKPDKLLALEAVLEELGQNIVRAYSGREALRCLLNDDFAVILLDVNMPGMDGFETAQLIRQRKSTEHVPIIFVTAFGDENHSARGYQLGAVDYIQTPVLSEVLKTKVSVFVDLYKKSEQVSRQAQWLRQRATQLHKLTGASLSINSAMSTERMLTIVTDTAREIIGAHRASTTMVPDQNWQHALTIVSATGKYDAWRDSGSPDGHGIQALVCRLNKPIRMSQRELEEHPVWQAQRNPEAEAGRIMPPPAPMRGWLAAPLTGRDGRNFGIVEVTDKLDDGEFSEDDQAILVQLAQMTSIAIENTIFAEERETNRIKDEFLSTLSHELRTPLNAILGWTQLLRVGPLDGEIGHAMEVIERNARAQAKLVEDLLDVSRVTTGKLRLHARPLHLSSVVSAAVEAVRPAAEEKQLTVDLACVAEDDRISGDGDRLQQVVWNLLNNAVKFTPAGGRIEVRLDRAASDLRLRVTDTGRGIPPAFLPYVFDRFRQADSTSTRSHGGLGIGLTIVRHIVELHHGAVHAESAGEGQGATFIVTLPGLATATISAISGDAPPADASPSVDIAPALPDEPAAAAAAFAEPAPIVPAASDRGSRTADLTGLRIIVVDDEPDAREVIARILSRAGAQATAAGSVRDALTLITSERPDLIVSDIAMPNEDGYDLIRIVRELSPTLGGPI
ncbi:MAG: hypothetical protein QOE14_3129, partial [Humisphaera sp.]|nr:hypothetical protein [Humisphaera sp.]